MRMLHRRFRISGEAGFSLIEVLAALVIFTLLTVGLVPLLTSSIRGSNKARADTIGKNAALKAMERVRGLPYYISYATSTDRVDVLDLHYPDAATDTVIGGRTVYQIVCPFDDLDNPACPRELPNGYTITFTAQFVDPVTSGVQPTPGETATSYANVIPATTYRWNSVTTDRPPRSLLQMAVTATWTVGEGASEENYTITSLLSDRSFGGRKIKATASLGYGADIYTQYDSRSGGGENLSTGNVFVGTAESDVEGRRLSTARQTATALRGELQRASGGSLATVTAATANVLQAPPDQNPGTINAAAGSLRHPDFANAAVAEYGTSSVISPVACAALSCLAGAVTPTAVGDTEITATVAGRPYYVAIRDPQLGPQDYNSFNIASGAPLVTFAGSGGLPGPLPGITAPVTTGDFVVGGTRTTTFSNGVHSQTTVGIDRIQLFEAGWAELSATESVLEGGTLTGNRHLIVIDDFQASVTCDSNSDGTGSGSAQWSATLYYWEDPPSPTGVRTDGRYRRLNLPAQANQLAALRSNPPLVYDHPSANLRKYLFATGTRNGFLSDWNALTPQPARVDESTDPTGAAVATVNASIEGALEIESGDLDVDRRDIGFFTFSLGSLSCFAEDAR